jgi:hypothetical protein
MDIDLFTRNDIVSSTMSRSFDLGGMTFNIPWFNLIIYAVILAVYLFVIFKLVYLITGLKLFKFNKENYKKALLFYTIGGIVMAIPLTLVYLIVLAFLPEGLRAFMMNLGTAIFYVPQYVVLKYLPAGDVLSAVLSYILFSLSATVSVLFTNVFGKK